MEFDQTKAIGLFVVLLLVLIGGTFSSPMETSTKGMVSGGLLIFGLLTFYIGMKHGEYRVTE